MATKLDRTMAYGEGFQSIKPHDPIVTGSCKIIRQSEKTVFYYHNAYGTKLGRVVNYQMGLPFIKLPELQSCGLARSSEKSKTLNLQNRNA